MIVPALIHLLQGFPAVLRVMGIRTAVLPLAAFPAGFLRTTIPRIFLCADVPGPFAGQAKQVLYDFNLSVPASACR